MKMSEIRPICIQKTAKGRDFGFKEAPADCWIYTIYPPFMSYKGLWDWHAIVAMTIFINLFHVTKSFSFPKFLRQLFRPEVRT